MNKQFIVLTTPENTEIIIGISNISIIETNPDNPNQTSITLNFARNKDLCPKTVLVKEELGLIKHKLGM
jgi:hypothetical protein